LIIDLYLKAFDTPEQIGVYNLGAYIEAPPLKISGLRNLFGDIVYHTADTITTILS
jgi:hypothetical protein